MHTNNTHNGSNNHNGNGNGNHAGAQTPIEVKDLSFADKISELAELVPGIRFVLCGKQSGDNWLAKAAKDGKQLHSGTDAQNAIAWLAGGSQDLPRHIGIKPASVKTLVIDADDGDPAEAIRYFSELGYPVGWAKSMKPGRGHILLPASGMADIGNIEFHEVLGLENGDIRHASGYVCIYDFDAWIKWLDADITDCVSAADLQPFMQSKTGPTARKDDGWYEGNRNNQLNKESFLAGKNGKPLEPIIRKGIASGLPQSEVIATAQSAFSAGAANRNDAVTGGDIPYLADGGSLQRILGELGLKLEYDERSARRLLNETPLDDMRQANLRNHIQENYMTPAGERGFKPLVYSNEKWKVARDSILHHNRFDPFIRWLEALPEWDGIARYRYLLTDPHTFAAEATNLSLFAPVSILVGAITRAYQPGYKLDEVVVLIGDQGIGKSTFLQCLLPDPDWFSDNLEWNAGAQRQRESLHGKVIVEAAEMQGHTKTAEVERIKSFITRTNDDARMAYREQDGGSKRRAIIVGTTNDDECLPMDPTGYRRWIPIRLTKGFNVEWYMRLNRDQLWAEALHEYKSMDRRPNLPREYMDDQAKETARHSRRYDFLETAISEYMDDPSRVRRHDDAGAEFIVAGHLHQWIHDNRPALRSEANPKKIGMTLRGMGYKKSRPYIDGKRPTIYWK